MNMPKVIRVGSVDYVVSTQKDIYEQGVHLAGQVVYPQTAIMVDEEMSPSRKDNVLIHEITHAIFNEAGYNEQDEDLINRVGNVLHGMLRDNDFGFIREREAE
ncbi:ImmA/IrrE family metallo-endopeptidase [Alkalihalobacillus sp. LMS6]|jgi:Zn-dependent peptidase ImmA (M78 family)|uniref:ImmA/IrrE family metallo-endopeptidase n=1 Tax=Alkalihalobacillus sp. LMS6 TaxID=2924034 RepID=UPI0020D0DE9D|nr:ImmA/IrrE family metallo-endopeptidase [Alkalihalobacillus sp. LMS6]UTR05177.1 ImmA/IrrE family metallo-endopeptidase [Alkalihalobacillus sp. LMS6]